MLISDTAAQIPAHIHLMYKFEWICFLYFRENLWKLNFQQHRKLPFTSQIQNSMQRWHCRQNDQLCVCVCVCVRHFRSKTQQISKFMSIKYKFDVQSCINALFRWNTWNVFGWWAQAHTPSWNFYALIDVPSLYHPPK